MSAQSNSEFAWRGEKWKVSKQNKYLLLEFKAPGVTKKDTVARVNNGSSWPQLTIDTSSSGFKGRMYLCWSEKKNGVNNEDVFLLYSDDKGKNWTERILITYYPNHKNQWEPKMSVDSKGRVMVLYFDAKNYDGSTRFDITLAVSTNGGLKFEQYRVNQDPLGSLSDPKIRLDEKGNVTIRSKNLNQKFLVSDTSIAYLNNENVKLLEIPKTISWNDSLLITFKSNEELLVSIALNKALDPLFRKVIVQEKKVVTGKNELLIDFRKLGLEKDNYVLHFYYKNRTEFTWILKE